MAIGYGEAAPKPEPRKRTKARKKRADAKGLKAFQDAVWARESQKLDPLSPEWARCEHCRRFVLRGGELRGGEVHHIIGRRAKATRYDPANGQLLCRRCHRLVQEHGGTVTKETRG